MTEHGKEKTTSGKEKTTSGKEKTTLQKVGKKKQLVGKKKQLPRSISLKSLVFLVSLVYAMVLAASDWLSLGFGTLFHRRSV